MQERMLHCFSWASIVSHPWHY